MAAVGYREPFPYALGGLTGVTWDRTIPKFGLFFRRGAILNNNTTGTILTPVPQGSMAALPGPPLSAITFGTSAVAGAPATSYYLYFAYTATTNESLVSGPFIQNVNAGFVPNLTVAAAGAPAAATNWAVFGSYTPTYEALQQATITTTALGSAFAFTNPLVNYTGAIQSASNVNTGIIGVAAADSNATFFSGAGGSVTVGNQSLFGATQSFPPLDSLGALAIPIIKLQNCLLEMSLVQPFFPGLINAAVGITLDATSGWHVADTTATGTGTIQSFVTGPPGFFGQVGDTGARVRVAFTPANLA